MKKIFILALFLISFTSFGVTDYFKNSDEKKSKLESMFYKDMKPEDKFLVIEQENGIYYLKKEIEINSFEETEAKVITLVYIEKDNIEKDKINGLCLNMVVQKRKNIPNNNIGTLLYLSTKEKFDLESNSLAIKINKDVYNFYGKIIGNEEAISMSGIVPSTDFLDAVKDITIETPILMRIRAKDKTFDLNIPQEFLDTLKTN